MQANQTSSNQTLYNQDYYLWLKTTQEKLQSQNFSELDIPNLIEELESMGKSEKRVLITLLTRLKGLSCCRKISF